MSCIGGPETLSRREIKLVLQKHVYRDPVKGLGGPRRSIAWYIILNGVMIDYQLERYSWEANVKAQECPDPLMSVWNNLKQALEHPGQIEVKMI